MRTTKAYKVEHFDELERKYWIAELALSAVLQDDVEWSPWITERSVTGRDEPGKYRVGHAASWRTDGGYWIVQFRCKGQRDQVASFLWEAQYELMFRQEYTSEYGRIMRECASKLKLTRFA